MKIAFGIYLFFILGTILFLSVDPSKLQNLCESHKLVFHIFICTVKKSEKFSYYLLELELFLHIQDYCGY